MSQKELSQPAPFGVGKIVAVVLIPVTFIGIIAYKTCPRGNEIGRIDVRGNGGTLAVDGSRGAVLNFRLDVKPGGKRVDRQLEASTLAVELDENGKLSTTSCKAYAGAVGSTGTWGTTGIVLECRLPMSLSGKASVRAKAIWAPQFTPDEAVLEVRRSEP
jgi:hypothetical protein